MVYIKSGYKRRYRKRYYKKNTLSKKNVFKKTTAKSQAGQIYSLKKKVNKLAYQIRPEVMIRDGIVFNRAFTTSGIQDGSFGVSEYHDNILTYKNALFGANYINYQMVGSLLRIYNFTIYGIFGNKNKDWVQNSGTDAAASMSLPQTGYLRIIVCKLNPQQAALPYQITRPLNTNLTEDFGLINGPLIDDISKTMKVVYNKVVKVDEQNPQKMFKITVKNPGSVGKPNTGNITSYNNEYMIYLQYYAPNVLKSTVSGQLGQVGPIHYLNMGMKFAFNDQ